MATLICPLQILLLLGTISIFTAKAELELSLTCPNSTTSTTLISTTTTTGISIGAVNLELVATTIEAIKKGEFGSLYLNTSGSYFLPSPVDGRLTNIKAFGIVEEETLKLELGVDELSEAALPIPADLDQTPYMYAVVYGLNANGMEYNLLFGPELITHEVAPASIILDVFVRKGDLIGLLLPSQCRDNITTDTLCPSRPNLRSRDDKCTSAFFHPMDSAEMVLDVIPACEFTKVLVNLSMNADIDIAPPDLGAIVGRAFGSIGCVAIIALIIILVYVGVRNSRKTRKQNQNTEKKDYFDNRVYGVTAFENPERAQPFHISSYEIPVSSNGVGSVHDYLEINTEILKSLPLRVVASSTNDPSEGHYVFKEGEYSYASQDPYFEPADEEEELIEQLNNQLLVTEISSDNLRLEKELGHGQFGRVFRGVLTTKKETNEEVLEEVAVKTMEGELTEEKRIKFLKEAVIMAQFKHPYVVCLKGILTDPQMMIVLDLMKGGDLKEYLLTTMRENLKTCHPLETSSVLLSFMRQIALGMHHFASKQYVHRDLAARNILVSADGTSCKIADFGLSRDLHDQDTYISHGGKIPVKWTAPEALKYRKYSTASDVWSYGCVLYEIWSLGEKPFQEMTNVEAMQHVVAGNRLPPPPGCPRAVYSIMIKCWHPSVDERPSFCGIMQELQKSDFHILKWSPDDINKYSLESRKLGSPLKYGRELYTDLQTIYLMKNAFVSDSL